MKKAKSAVKRSVGRPAKDYIRLEMLDAHTLRELPIEDRRRAYGIQGAIRQLCTIHNQLLDQRELVSDGNKAYVTRSMHTLEAAVEKRIAGMNLFLSDALDLARRSSSKKKGTRRGRPAGFKNKKSKKKKTRKGSRA